MSQVSVLDAIREGMWDFEPQPLNADEYSATKAMPGTKAKLDVLAERAQRGLPLWHDEDRVEYDDGKDLPPSRA
ncbi:hypothetical protein [Aeoliella mucimassa]|uniref:hypothetical protein n=1 Tax=Aeoliella mucimassa TaxID=2527972 RepID=UPI001E5DBDBD|nr:hypothetical protein [Aeoliella mucimassa]